MQLQTASDKHKLEYAKNLKQLECKNVQKYYSALSALSARTCIGAYFAWLAYLRQCSECCTSTPYVLTDSDCQCPASGKPRSRFQVTARFKLLILTRRRTRKQVLLKPGPEFQVVTAGVIIVANFVIDFQ